MFLDLTSGTIVMGLVSILDLPCTHGNIKSNFVNKTYLCHQKNINIEIGLEIQATLL